MHIRVGSIESKRMDCGRKRRARQQAGGGIGTGIAKKGFWGMLTHAVSSGHGTRLPPLFVLRDARIRRHLFRRKNSWPSIATMVFGFVVLAGLGSHGAPLDGFLVGVTIMVASQVSPWTGLRLRVAIFQRGLPKWARKLRGWVVSQQELQLRTEEDTEHLISRLGPRMHAIAGVVRAD